MHRAYQPITPANNKLLKKRWDMSRYDTHRRKVCCHGAPRSNFWLHLKPDLSCSLWNCLLTFHSQVKSAKAVIDNKPPKTYMHLHLKLKKLQVLWSFYFRRHEIAMTQLTKLSHPRIRLLVSWNLCQYVKNSLSDEIVLLIKNYVIYS